MVKHHLYISTATDLEEGDILDILESCQRNNAERNITGFLLYNGRNFLQLLEGEKDDLRYVLRRIAGDPRHSGISTLEEIESAERACPDWLMRRIELTKDVAERRSHLDTQLPGALNPHLRRLVLNFAALN